MVRTVNQVATVARAVVGGWRAARKSTVNAMPAMAGQEAKADLAAPAAPAGWEVMADTLDWGEVGRQSICLPSRRSRTKEELVQLPVVMELTPLADFRASEANDQAPAVAAT